MAFTNVKQVLFDLVCMVVALPVSWGILRAWYVIPAMATYLWILIFFGTVLLLAMIAQDMYNKSNFSYRDRIVRNVFLSCLVAAILSVGLLPYMSAVPYMKQFLGILILVCTGLLTTQWVITSSYLVSKAKKAAPHAVIVGDHALIDQYLYFLEKTSFKIEFVGYVANECIQSKHNMPCLGTIDEMEDIIGNVIVDEVIFAMPHTEVSRMEKYMQICEERGLTIKVALDFKKVSYSKSGILLIGPMPVIMHHTVSLDEVQLFMKRGMDIIGALVGLLMTALLSLFIIPAIMLDSPGAVFFKQTRMGRNGRTFTLYKFRSMCTDAEHLKLQLEAQNQVKDNMMFKIKNDPRVTKVGSFLRRTSLDELPQFINVLRGEMSLVGTRPPTMDEVSRYAHFHHRRISIKPGITGLWQISGRSDITNFDEVVRLDTLYIDNWSVWKDVSIILRTVWMILFKRQHAY